MGDEVIVKIAPVDAVMLAMQVRCWFKGDVESNAGA